MALLGFGETDSGRPQEPPSQGAHTPGPWAMEAGLLVSREVGIAYPIYQLEGVPEDDEIGIICGGPEQHAANLRLIAAAPDLYAVLYEMFCEGPVEVAFAGNPHAIERLHDRVRAALAKAEGRE